MGAPTLSVTLSVYLHIARAVPALEGVLLWDRVEHSLLGSHNPLPLVREHSRAGGEHRCSRSQSSQMMRGMLSREQLCSFQVSVGLHAKCAVSSSELW